MILIQQPTGTPTNTHDERAMATWNLRRHRKVTTGTPEQQRLLREYLADSSIRADGYFMHGDQRTPVRPSAAALIRCLLQAEGTPVAVGEVCQAVYGRPASLRAIRQAAFRASRAFERVNCPLTVCCHAGFVFVRTRVRVFERVGMAGA